MRIEVTLTIAWESTLIPLFILTNSFSLTLVDSLDTLVVMGEIEEFEKGLKLLKNTLSFDTDLTVSVFETTIRVLGGLLSIHLLAEQHSDSFSEPYQGEFLTFAQDLGNRLLPAFNTPTGIPWSRVRYQPSPSLTIIDKLETRSHA